MSTTHPAPWYTAADCRLEDLLEVLRATTDLVDYPHAERIEQVVLIYSSAHLRDVIDSSPTAADDVRAELARALSEGPGIVVLAGAFEAGPLDRATEAFWSIIEAQRASGLTSGAVKG